MRLDRKDFYWKLGFSRNSWSLKAQGGWVRLILDRFHDLVLSAGDPTAPKREPDSASHEHQTFFFPNTGVAPPTLLASAGVGAAVSKRPFLLSGPPCCVRTCTLLREGAKTDRQKELRAPFTNIASFIYFCAPRRKKLVLTQRAPDFLLP
jgi:hypothetical protein